MNTEDIKKTIEKALSYLETVDCNTLGGITMENSLNLEYCKNYNNWCEKEKRTCKNCYYENTKDKKEIKTMVEDIKEALQEKYKNLKIEVEYVKIKMYSIKIGTKTIFYEWKDNLTFSANIESIKCYIDLIIGGKQ